MGHPTEEQALGLGTDDGGIEDPPVPPHRDPTRQNFTQKF